MRPRNHYPVRGRDRRVVVSTSNACQANPVQIISPCISFCCPTNVLSLIPSSRTVHMLDFCLTARDSNKTLLTHSADRNFYNFLEVNFQRSTPFFLFVFLVSALNKLHITTSLSFRFLDITVFLFNLFCLSLLHLPNLQRKKKEKF